VLVLEELFEKFEVDPQIARDLGDALKLAMLDAQALAENTAAQLTSSSWSEPNDTLEQPDWRVLRELAEALTAREPPPQGDAPGAD
jgi:hypothetical protein